MAEHKKINEFAPVFFTWAHWVKSFGKRVFLNVINDEAAFMNKIIY